MCLYFELLFKCATTASLHSLLWLRWNKFCNEVTESQSESAGMPRNFCSSAAVQTKNKYYNLTVADGAESELSCERRTLSDQDILLETDNISNVEIKYRGFRICKVVHSEKEKQNCRLRKREWLIFLGFRAMSRKNTKISCNHFKVKSRFSFKIIR